MFRINSPQDNAISATYLFLKSIGAKVTEETVEETLRNHPHYPSLLATSDALNEWHIENASLRIKPEQLTEIPTPFLTYLALNGGSFVVVKSIKENTIEWLSSDKKAIKENLVDFIKKWSGVILVAEINENSGEEDYQKNRRKEFLSGFRFPLFLLALLATFINVFYHTFSNDWHYNTLLVTKLLGTFISSILLWQSIDKNNPFIQKLCQFNTKTNCNSILNSSVAQITPWLSWSEVGFFYFAGGFVSLLIVPASFPLFQILASLAIIYTCWSIYYQGFIAKQWCILCLLVQGVICIEFFISLPVSFPSLLKELNTFSFNNSLTVLQGFLAPALVWIFLKPILQKSQQTNKLKNDVRKFKNNPDFFLNQLHTQPEMPFISKVLDPVVIGHSKALYTITIVTNPFCQPCAKVHK
ncbi:MAG TPA: vitamin K epoxide reductase family protein, partial [Emticicia sp.]